MKLTIQERPAEMLFALLMAVSPIVGAIWVTPDVTKWIVLGVGVVTLGNFMGNQALRSDGEKVVQTLREAHVRATASEQDSSWGVTIDTISSPDRLVLFKGSDYALRDPGFDQITTLYPNANFGPLLLNGGGNTLVFAKRSGMTAQDGLFSLISGAQAFTVSVNPLGLTDFTTPTF